MSCSICSLTNKHKKYTKKLLLNFIILSIYPQNIEVYELILNVSIYITLWCRNVGLPPIYKYYSLSLIYPKSIYINCLYKFCQIHMTSYNLFLLRLQSLILHKYTYIYLNALYNSVQIIYMLMLR